MDSRIFPTVLDFVRYIQTNIKKIKLNIVGLYRMNLKSRETADVIRFLATLCFSHSLRLLNTYCSGLDFVGRPQQSKDFQIDLILRDIKVRDEISAKIYS